MLGLCWMWEHDSLFLSYKYSCCSSERPCGGMNGHPLLLAFSSYLSGLVTESFTFTTPGLRQEWCMALIPSTAVCGWHW